MMKSNISNGEGGYKVPEDQKPEDKQTRYLNMPSSEVMPDRSDANDTAVLTLEWSLRLSIGDQLKRIPVIPKILIGRAADEGDDDIDLDLTPYGAYHFGVSRHHAVMTYKNGYVYLEDLDSTNGTRINGFQLSPNQKYRLRDGDEIEFARLRTNLHFEAPE